MGVNAGYMSALLCGGGGDHPRVPSLRYPLAGSPPTLANGRTAIESSGGSRKAKYRTGMRSSSTEVAIANTLRRWRLTPVTMYSALEMLADGGFEPASVTDAGTGGRAAGAAHGFQGAEGDGAI